MNRRPSRLGARVSGRRAGTRFDAESGVTTEALLFLGDLDPEAIGPNLAHATHYEPTPVGDFEALVHLVPFPLQRCTFVDLGAGMGRIVFLAARYPFRQVMGVEISPALHAVARENLARCDTTVWRCRDVRFVRADASTFRIPRGPLVIYLYNPFDEVVLGRVLDRLTAAVPREIALIYHTPVHGDIIQSHPAFQLIAHERRGNVYATVSTQEVRE